MSTALDISEARGRLRSATERVRDLKGDGARILHELGTVLREVEEQELWRAGGHASFAAWLEDEAEVARGTAYRAMEVARHFNAEIATRYGFDKLYLGLRYMELTRAREQPGDLIAADLRIRGPSGRFLSVPFHQASVRQVQEAVRLAAAGRSPRLSSSGDGLSERLSRLKAALPPPPAGMAVAKERVEVARTRGGEVALTFRQIPLKDLAAFVAALQAELGEEEPG